jgi:zinc protease
MIISQRIQDAIVSEIESPLIDFSANAYEIIDGNPVMHIHFVAKEKSLLEAFKRTLQELKRFKQHGIDSQEFFHVKKNLTGALHHALVEKEKIGPSTYTEICKANFERKTTLLHPRSIIKTMLAKLNNMTLQQLNERLRYLLQDENFFAGFIQPQKDSLQFTKKDVFTAISEVKKENVSKYQYKQIHKTLLKEIPKPGKILKKTSHTKTGITEYILANGIRVLAKPTTFLQGSVVLQGHSTRGLRDVSSRDPITAKFCSAFYEQCGLGELSLTELTKVLSGKQASMETFIGKYSTKVTSTCSKKDLETSFQMLHLLFKDAGYSQSAFNLALKKAQEVLKNIHTHPQLQFSYTVSDVNTQKHPDYTHLELKDLAQINYNTCKQMHKNLHDTPSDFTFTIVGNYSESELTRLIETYFASLPAKPKNAQTQYSNVPFPKGITYKNVRAAESKKCAAAFTFPATVSDANSEKIAAELVFTILEQRLYKRLRLDKGMTYNVSCNFSPNPFPGLNRIDAPTSLIHISFANESDKKNIENIIKKEIEVFQNQGPKENEVEEAKKSMTKDHQEKLQTNGGRLSTIQQWVLWHEEEKFDQDDHFTDTLNTYTAKMLQEQSKKLLPMNNYTMVTLLPQVTV